MWKIIKNLLNLNFYVSELDRFLADYDKAHPDLSKSQRKEFEKYQRIYQFRDNPEAVARKRSSFFENF